MDGWIEYALTGLAAGATGAVIGYSVKFGVDVTAVFGFFGALSGAWIAVRGAIYFSDREKRLAHDAEKNIILRFLMPLDKTLDEIISLWPSQTTGFSDEFRKELTLSGSHSYKASAVLGEALEYSRTLDFRQRASLRQCLEALKEYLSSYEYYANPTVVDRYGDEELTWQMGAHRAKGFIRLLVDALNDDVHNS